MRKYTKKQKEKEEEQKEEEENEEIYKADVIWDFSVVRWSALTSGPIRPNATT